MAPMRALLFLLLSVSLLTRLSYSQVEIKADPCKHQQWLFSVMTEIETIKPGSTRADLLKVFKPQPGFIVGPGRSFMYRSSPYIKVDVEFTYAEGGGESKESPSDVVKSISKPYLGPAVFD